MAGEMLSDDSSPTRIGWFVCVDLDRTVLKSTSLFYRYVEPALQSIAERRASDEADLSRRQQVIATLVRDVEENIGRSFDLVAAYNERVDQSERLEPEQLADEVIGMLSIDGKRFDEKLTKELLAEGALQALIQIDQFCDGNWGFLTSGGLKTQRFKLIVVAQILDQLTGLRPPALIVSTEHKARDIDSVWRQADGWFRVPNQLTSRQSVVARWVALIDDKPKNLHADNLVQIATVLVEQLDAPDDGHGRIKLEAVPKLLHNLDKK